MTTLFRDKDYVVDSVSSLVTWWLKQRIKKFENKSHETMAVNPFLAPLIMGLHGFETFEDLAGFLLGGHFSVGHATGFGKLVDEKMLPRVFGTSKLDAQFRRREPYNRHQFDNIDHVVELSGEKYLLSLKASRWTIQLGQAVDLNRAFKNLLDLKSEGYADFHKIVIATFYGSREDLTDKYRIVQGITTGKVHDVVDIHEAVDVLAGRAFWTWIGNGETSTQDWVMLGILKSLGDMSGELQEANKELDHFSASFREKYDEFIDEDGKVNWIEFLKAING